jgi:hypothetical protein
MLKEAINLALISTVIFGGIPICECREPSANICVPFYECVSQIKVN